MVAAANLANDLIPVPKWRKIQRFQRAAHGCGLPTGHLGGSRVYRSGICAEPESREPALRDTPLEQTRPGPWRRANCLRPSVRPLGATMHFFRFSLIIALAFPATLAAQRGGYPSRGNVRGNSRREPPPELRTKDLENLNPAKIAIERQNDLGLSADAVGRLDSAAKAYDLEAKEFGTSAGTLQNIIERAERNLFANPRCLCPHISRD